MILYFHKKITRTLSHNTKGGYTDYKPADWEGDPE